MKRLLVLMILAPTLALALPEAAAGPGGADARAPGPEASRRAQRLQRALTLGLAEALDLSSAQALQVRDQLQAQAPRRQAAHQQLREAVQLLRRSARGGPVAAPEVERATAQLFEARAQLQAVDRELVAAVTRGQPPEQQARAVLFLARFHRRAMQGFGREGRHGPGRGHDRGHGPTGMIDGPEENLLDRA